MDKIVMEYLRSRGHESAATALGQALGGDGASASNTLSAQELLKKMAVFAASGNGENAYKSTANILQELVASGTSSNIKSLIMNMGDGGAEDALSLDPGDKQEGFRDLEAWVEGSLDMYRVRMVVSLWLYPALCSQCKARIPPYIIPSVLSLLPGPRAWRLQGCWYARVHTPTASYSLACTAQKFFETFSGSIATQRDSLNWLTAIRLPHHVQSDQHAQRFRNQKYVIQMSHSGFDLLIGWLTEGVGGEALGAGEGFSGEQGKRGRAAVMRVVNNHLSFNGNDASSYINPPTAHSSLSDIYERGSERLEYLLGGV